MKTSEEIEKALNVVDTDGTRYPGMTYEQGIEEALLWVLGDIADDDFEFAGGK